MAESLDDDEQRDFRSERGWVEDHIFTLKQIGQKAREKKRRVYVGLKCAEKPF